ncbi:unnamed protein product, partial [Discosporangium mesarthrocarpum]
MITAITMMSSWVMHGVNWVLSRLELVRVGPALNVAMEVTEQQHKTLTKVESGNAGLPAERGWRLVLRGYDEAALISSRRLKGKTGPPRLPEVVQGSGRGGGEVVAVAGTPAVAGDSPALPGKSGQGQANLEGVREREGGQAQEHEGGAGKVLDRRPATAFTRGGETGRETRLMGFWGGELPPQKGQWLSGTRKGKQGDNTTEPREAGGSKGREDFPEEQPPSYEEVMADIQAGIGNWDGWGQGGEEEGAKRVEGRNCGGSKRGSSSSEEDECSESLPSYHSLASSRRDSSHPGGATVVVEEEK